MVMLHSAHRRAAVPDLARWLLGLGIATTLEANVAHGLGHGLIGVARRALSRSAQPRQPRPQHASKSKNVHLVQISEAIR